MAGYTTGQTPPDGLSKDQFLQWLQAQYNPYGKTVDPSGGDYWYSHYQQYGGDYLLNQIQNGLKQDAGSAGAGSTGATPTLGTGTKTLVSPVASLGSLASTPAATPTNLTNILQPVTTTNTQTASMNPFGSLQGSLPANAQQQSQSSYQHVLMRSPDGKEMGLVPHDQVDQYTARGGVVVG